MNEQTKSILSFVRTTLLWFLIFYLGISWWQGRNETEGNAAQSQIAETGLIKTMKKKVVKGNPLIWNGILPKDTKDFDICGDKALKVVTAKGTEFVNVMADTTCDEKKEIFQLDVDGNNFVVNLESIQEELKLEPAEYLLEVNVDEKTITSDATTLKEPGAFRVMFRRLLSEPIFNALIWITENITGKIFGLGVILLTLIIRGLLFFPNQSAIKSQQKMQAIQPKIKALQTKHKDNQQEIAKETMALYKQHGVNPAGGCLPILLQMPILLALYYTLQNGLTESLKSLQYSSLKDIDFMNFNQNFLWLDLSEPDRFILPIVVGVAQWVAFKLSMSTQAAPNAQMVQMQKIMQWGLPIMIGVFTASLPSAVGLYWLVSTVFGAAQHYVLRKNNPKPA